MEYWHRLNWFQKTIACIGVICFLIVAPETVPSIIGLIDIGGVELVFGFIVLNAKSWLSFVRVKYENFKSTFIIFHNAVRYSAVAKPKTFVTHAVFCSVALFVTGSFLLSVSFLLPVLMANGVLV